MIVLSLEHSVASALAFSLLVARILPVLLMTAYGDVDKAVAAMRGGACDFLMKPFEPEVLLEHVRRYAAKPPSADDAIAEDVRTRHLLALPRCQLGDDALFTRLAGVGPRPALDRVLQEAAVQPYEQIVQKRVRLVVGHARRTEGQSHRMTELQTPDRVQFKSEVQCHISVPPFCCSVALSLCRSIILTPAGARWPRHERRC